MSIDPKPFAEAKPRFPPGWWDWDPRAGAPVQAAGASELGARFLAPTAAGTPTTRLIDVSHWQGLIDWGRVRASGRVAMICKCTEGTRFIDATAQRNRREAARAGMIPGGYLFLRRGQHVPAQVAAFLDVLGDPDGKLIALDAETAGDGTDPTRAEVFDAAEELRARTGRWPIAYIPRWWWSKIGNGTGPTACPLWHSAYASSPGPLYGGWSAFTAWQFTSSAAVPGVQGRCDDNVFFGTADQLRALTTSSTAKEEWFDMATQQDLIDALHAVADDRTHPFGQAVENARTMEQRVVDAIHHAAGDPTHRFGASLATIPMLNAAVAAIQAGQVTAAQLTEAVRQGLASINIQVEADIDEDAFVREFIAALGRLL